MRRARTRPPNPWPRRGLGAVALLSLALWIASFWWSAWLATGPIPIFTSGGFGGAAGLIPGVLFAGGWWESAAPTWAPEWEIARSSEKFRWWFDGEIAWAAGKLVFLAVPLWLVALASGAASAGMCWRARRRPSWACRACGYDMRGIAGTLCPECGKGKRAGEATPAPR